MIESDRPVVIDAYCGVGGASMGYHLAGYRIIGVDIKPQPDYPYEFHQADACGWLVRNARRINPRFIHASPPCQRYTDLAKRNGNADKHPDLIPVTRRVLDALGFPYVIENVPGAPIRNDLTLCGEMFALRVIRHRRFEIHNLPIETLPHVPHRGRVIGWRYGVKHEGHYYGVWGDGGGKGSVRDWQDAMRIGWTLNRKSLAEAIPPAYTFHIGGTVIRHDAHVGV